MAQSTANFDNITFFSNAIDVLAGDESFIALRNRRGAAPDARARSRRRRGRSSIAARAKSSRPQKDAQAALEEARSRLKKRVDEIDARTDLDEQAKQIMVRNLEETENRQLRVLETNIALARRRKIRASRETMEAQIRNIRNAHPDACRAAAAGAGAARRRRALRPAHAARARGRARRCGRVREEAA